MKLAYEVLFKPLSGMQSIPFSALDQVWIEIDIKENLYLQYPT